MENKQVGFNGIERVNKGIYCNDNACEELINLRYDGNTWRSVGKKLLKEDVKGIIKQHTGVLQSAIIGVYVHNSSKDKYYIVHQNFGITEYISLYTISDEGMGTVAGTGNVLYALITGETLLSVSSLNNVLILCTSIKKLYFVWKDDAYIQINMDLNNNGVLVASAYQDLNTDGSYKIHYYDSGLWSVVYDASLMIRNTYAKLLESAHTNGLYSGLSFFRYAVKMYDGSYLYYSNIDFADTNGDNGGTNGSEINNLIFSLSAKLEINNTRSYRTGSCINNVGHHNVDINFNSLAIFKELLDLNIIISIDVYMTRPILQIDIDCDKTELKICNDIGIYEYSISSNGADVREFYRCPVNKTAILDQITNGLYYKVKSFNKEDVNKAIKNNLNTLSVEILYKDIETLTSNETLVTDNGRNEILFSNNYTYNRKQHIYDLIYNIFNGYTYPRGTGYSPASLGDYEQLCSRIGVVGGTMYALVKGKHNNKDFAVRIPISNPIDYISYSYYVFIQTYKINFYVPRFFMYPTMESFELNVYITNGTTSKLIYTKESDEISYINNFGYIASLYADNNINEYFNSAICGEQTSSYVSFAPLIESNLKKQSSTKYISALTSYEPKLIGQLSFKNTLQLTETDNPFIFPAVNSYAFGEESNEILSVQATVGQITETKFGLFPLYVFTDIGIFAMGVGTGEIAYANTTPINTQIIRNRQTLNIGNSIMYLSDNGLNVIAGRETRLVSELVKGMPDSSKIIATILSDISSKFDFSDSDFSKVDFLDEIRSAKFAYDNVHNEVLFICPNYTYVYNVKSNNFHKITDKFKDVYMSGDDVILSKEEFDIYGMTQAEIDALADGRVLMNSIKFYSPSLESNSVNNRVLIISKPFNLGTRQFKKVSRFILSMSIEKLSFINAPANAEVWVFGTNNMVDYVPYKNISVASEKDIQDIHTSRFFKSFNYAVLVVASKQIECNVSGGSFEYDIVRGQTGQR